MTTANVTSLDAIRNFKGALLRFAKAHAPTTASAIVDAVHRLLGGLGSGVEDDTAVLALGVSLAEQA